MSISGVRHINSDENNRVEFLFVGFDYYNGNELSANILHEKCDIDVGGKIDGIFYSIIPLDDNGIEYKLVWHEDVGNYIYSENQSEASIKRMEELVEIIVTELNKKIG